MDELKRILLTIVLAILFYSEAVSSKAISHNNFRIERASESDLLTQQSIDRSVEDSRGLIWFVTESGLNRFDGYQMQRYTAGRDNDFHIPHNFVTSILHTSNGDTFIASGREGLIKYDLNKRDYKKLVQISPTGSFSSRQISSIYEDSRGVIWIGDMQGNVSYYDPFQDTITQVVPQPKGESSLSYIKSFAELDYQNIFIATRSAGLFVLNRFSNSLEQIRINTSEEPGNDVTELSSIALDHRTATLYIGSQNDGLFEFNIKTKRMKSYTASNGLPDNSVNQVYLDRKSRLWIATERGLSLKLDNQFINFDRKNSELSDDFVLSIYQDSRQVFWIGTLHGLFKGYISNFETFNSKSGLEVELVTGFAEHKDGAIIISTYGDVYEFKKSVFRKNEFLGQKINLRENKVTAISIADDNLYIGYRNSGLDLISSRPDINGNSIQSPIQTTVLSSKDKITAISDTKDDLIWVSTFGEGFFAIGESKDQAPIERYKVKNANFVYQAIEAQDGALYVATTDGLLEKKTRSQQPIKVTSDQSSTIKIERESIYDIHETDNGDLWFGLQDNGLAIWRYADRSANHYRFDRVVTDPTIPSDVVYRIEKGMDNDIWISTTMGLVQIDTETMRSRHFTKWHGLQANEFVNHSSMRDTQGRLYFGGSHGFNRFHPEDIVIDETPPSLSMTDIRISGQSVSYDPIYALPEQIGLSSAEDYIEFDFSVIDFSNPSQNTYRYKLQNFDEDWVELGHRRTITFTSLPPDEYTLHINGANPDGIWSDQPLALKLRVYPAPWLSWWAFCIYGFFLLCIAAIIKKNYDANVLRIRAEESADRSQVTAERAMDSFMEKLQSEQAMLGNMHRYYNNALGLVSGLLENQSSDIQNEALQSKFEDNQQRLWCLQEIENNLIHLGPMIQVDFHQFVDALLSKQQQIHAKSDLDIPLINTSTDNPVPASIASPMAIICNELVDNAFRHAFTEPSGLHFLKVDFRETEDHLFWQLEVIDNGCQLPDSIDPNEPTTLGMSLVKQCAKQLGAEVEVLRNSGTHFIVKMPLPDLKTYEGS